jgi:transcriptional regulator with XRE-family HTH domain
MSKNEVHPTEIHVGNRVRMRRLMLGLSQTQLGEALGISFQQLQKYEKGTNRISASRLQGISQILQVPVEFFFEGSSRARGQHSAQRGAPSPQFVSDYLATSDGLNLTVAFMRIQNAQLRRSIVNLVEAIAGPEDSVQRNFPRTSCSRKGNRRQRAAANRATCLGCSPAIRLLD